MASFRLLCALCLVTGIIAVKKPSECLTKGFRCKFLLFCSSKNRVPISGCGFLQTCCRKKAQTCKSIHGTCQNTTAVCLGLKHGLMECPKGQSCCVSTVH
uniref:Putative carboxypeptidase inhibitor n=1 Tax=Rhipicephalus pulchellus TaxID=72859 RepID=L7M972_RHIPC